MIKANSVCYGNDLPVCPYCDTIQHNIGDILFPAESGDSETETSCDNCESDFEVERIVTISYTTRRNNND